MIKQVTVQANECTCQICGGVWIPSFIRVLAGNGRHQWVCTIPDACRNCQAVGWQERPTQVQPLDVYKKLADDGLKLADFIKLPVPVPAGKGKLSGKTPGKKSAGKERRSQASG